MTRVSPEPGDATVRYHPSVAPDLEWLADKNISVDQIMRCIRVRPLCLRRASPGFCYLGDLPTVGYATPD